MIKHKTFEQFVNEIDIQENPAVTPGYFSSLNARGEHNVRKIEQRYGGEMVRFMDKVHQLQEMQKGHENELEQLAEEVILDQFGSILGGVKLDIKFPEPTELKIRMNKEKPEPTQKPDFKEIEDEETKTAIHKRKILNMITQGEALNAKKMFTNEVAMDGLTVIFGDEARQYVDLLIAVTDMATAMDWRIPEEVAKRMWEEGNGFSGTSEIEWDDKDDEDDSEETPYQEEDDDEPEKENDSNGPTIVVRGLDFAMLIHESIKGIYSLINQGGLAHLSDEVISKVFMNTDTIDDEIQDLKRAKMTASDLRDFLNHFFPEVGNMDNGREYVWGKMIDARLVPDEEFLKLMRSIWLSAPLYRNVSEDEPQYSEEDRQTAEQEVMFAQRTIGELIKIIKDELSDWENQMRDYQFGGGDYQDYEDDDDEYAGTIDDYIHDGEPDLGLEPKGEEELSPRQIQDLIDQALDRRDFEEVKRLQSLMESVQVQVINELQSRYDYFVNEVLSEEQKEQAAEELRDLQAMINQGMLDKHEFIVKRREIMRKVGGISRLVADPVLGNVCMPELCEAMESQQFRALQEAGWYSSSTDKQLFNGTIAVTTDAALRGGPDNLPTSIAISSNGYIRRIWTAGPTGYRNWHKHAHGEPQVLVNNLPGTGVDQYLAAFEWILTTIDGNSPGLKSINISQRRPDNTGIRRYRGY